MPTLQLLLTHIDYLRGLHRAGQTPPYGEVERLFDLAADVRSDIATAAQLPRPAAAPAVLEVGRARLAIEILDAGGAVAERLLVAEVDRG